MKTPVLAALAALAAHTGAAQGLRDGDLRFDARGLSEALSGQIVIFYDGSQAEYAAGGAYAYRYAPDEPPFVGTYDTTEDGQVCVAFDNGFARCDTYVLAQGRMTLIIEDGTRFPVREMRAIED